MSSEYGRRIKLWPYRDRHRRDSRGCSRRNGDRSSGTLHGVVDRGRSECDGGGTRNGGRCIVGDRTGGHAGEQTAAIGSAATFRKGPSNSSIQVVIHDCCGEGLHSADLHAGAWRRDGYGSWCWWRLRRRRRVITAAAGKAEK